MSPLPTTTNTPNPRSQGLHARINSTYYRLVSLQDAIPAIQTAPLQPPRIDTAANPEDIRPEFGTIYSLVDFTGGEGLDFAHRPNPTPRDSTRYWDSERIDVSRVEPGTAQSFRLARNVDEQIVSTNQQYAFPSIAFFDGSLWMVDNAAIRLNRYDTFTTGSPLTLSAAENPQIGVGNGLGGLVVHGDDLYVSVLNDGINSRSEAGTWSNFSQMTTVDKLYSVKGRIIGAGAGVSNNELHEIRAGIASNSVLLHTLEVGYRWTDVEESGGFVVASSNDGYIYLFTFDEATAALALTARHRITGDSVHGVSAVPGTNLIYIAYVDNAKVKVLQAALDTDGTLVNGRIIIEEPSGAGITIGDKPIPMLAQENAMHVLMTDGWLWKHDLVTDGRFKFLQFDASETRWTWTTLLSNSSRWFAFRNSSGSTNGGIFRSASFSSPSTTYETTGYLISPLIDHFTSANKTWAGLTIDIDTVPTGCSIQVHYSTDPAAITNPSHSSWVLAKNVTAGNNDLTETPLSIQSRYLTVKVTLTGNGTNTPIFRSFSTRAFPGPGDIILTLPINTSDQIEMPGRQRQLVPNLGDLVYESLRNIEGTSVTCELLDPSETITGVVESVSSRLMLPTVRGSETLTTIVKVRGRRSS